MALRKVIHVASADQADAGGAADDAGLYPSLWEHLNCRRYPDGTARETSTIVIVAQDGRWKGCLSDKDNERVMWKAGDTLDALLTALEEAAAADDPSDWRRAAPQVKAKKKG